MHPSTGPRFKPFVLPQEDSLSAVNLILREENRGQFPRGHGAFPRGFRDLKAKFCRFFREDEVNGWQLWFCMCFKRDDRLDMDKLNDII